MKTKDEYREISTRRYNRNRREYIYILFKKINKSMEINFSTYNGLAGDTHLLLIAETNCGIKETTLFDRTSIFGLSFYFARKKLIKRIRNQKIELCLT